MSMTLKERLEVLEIFYKDKARQPENADKASYYSGEAEGIKKAIKMISEAEDDAE